LYNRKGALTRAIEKRACLHRQLKLQQQLNALLQLQLSRLEVLANIGMVSCMIAHEINNLLTPLVNYATLARRNPDDRALLEKTLDKTINNTRRAAEVMESLLALVNGQVQQKESIELKDIVKRVFSCLCRDFAKDSITVKIDIPEHLVVRAVPVQLQQVLMNLILNAREAMLPRGGILTIKAGQNEQITWIDISDTGCGIEPADREKIFEPFFSTKSRPGSSEQYQVRGLGLALCKKIIEAHEGSIQVESDPNEGTTFKVTLPRPQAGSG